MTGWLRKLRTGDRQTIVVTAAVVVGLAILGIGGLEATMRPGFCGSCHIMKPYYKEWKESPHGRAGVACVKCHIDPGLVALIKRKGGAAKELVTMVTRTEPPRPRSHVNDAACLRPGCHVKSDLGADTAAFGGSVRFDHQVHLNGQSPYAALRCATCHAQTVYGRHIGVNKEVCVLCHVLRNRDSVDVYAKEACLVCHTVPQTEVTIGAAGQTFDHSMYAGEDVQCAHCHGDVHRGAGTVSKAGCRQCHKSPEVLEAMGETEALHEQHVVKHKVECILCHEPIEHTAEPVDGERIHAEIGSCASCHGGSTPSVAALSYNREAHRAAVLLYGGKGGRGVEGTPPAKAIAGVDCIGCHRGPGAASGGAHALTAATEAACIACHGEGADAYLTSWRADLTAASDRLASLLSKASAAGVDGEAVETARHNYELVRVGGGVHNPDYALALLEHGARLLEAAAGD